MNPILRGAIIGFFSGLAAFILISTIAVAVVGTGGTVIPALSIGFIWAVNTFGIGGSSLALVYGSTLLGAAIPTVSLYCEYRSYCRQRGMTPRFCDPEKKVNNTLNTRSEPIIKVNQKSIALEVKEPAKRHKEASSSCFLSWATLFTNKRPSVLSSDVIPRQGTSLLGRRLT